MVEAIFTVKIVLLEKFPHPPCSLERTFNGIPSLSNALMTRILLAVRSKEIFEVIPLHIWSL